MKSFARTFCALALLGSVCASSTVLAAGEETNTNAPAVQVGLSKKRVAAYAMTATVLTTLGLVCCDYAFNHGKLTKVAVTKLGNAAKTLGQKLGLVAKPKTWWNSLFGK